MARVRDKWFFSVFTTVIYDKYLREEFLNATRKYLCTCVVEGIFIIDCVIYYGLSFMCNMFSVWCSLK